MFNSSCYLFMITICVYNSKRLYHAQMWELQYMFAADLFPVSFEHDVARERGEAMKI